MNILTCIKKSLLGLLVIFCVASGLLVAGGIGLGIYAYHQNGEEDSDTHGKQDSPKTQTRKPVYEEYESAANHIRVIEDALKDREYGGIRLDIRNLALMERVVLALELLKREATLDYNYVLDHTKRIQEGKRTYASGQGITTISRASTSGSVVWTASTLVHEAVHLGEHTDDARESEFKEREALDQQIRVLERLEAPADMIDYLKKERGDHADRDGDGQNSHLDFILHEW